MVEEATSTSARSERASIRQHALQLLARLKGPNDDDTEEKIDYDEHDNDDDDDDTTSTAFSNQFRDEEEGLHSSREEYYTTDEEGMTTEDEYVGHEEEISGVGVGDETDDANYRHEARKLLDRVGDYGVKQEHLPPPGAHVRSNATDSNKNGTFARTAKVTDAGFGRGEQRRRRRQQQAGDGGTSSSSPSHLDIDVEYSYDVSADYSKYDERKIHHHQSLTNRISSKIHVLKNKNPTYNDDSTWRLLMISLISMFLAGVVYFYLL